MFVHTAHGPGRAATILMELSDRVRQFWLAIRASLATPDAPAEIDWEDGEAR